MIEPDTNPLRSFKEMLEQELRPFQIINECGHGFTIFGLSAGYKGSLGNDAIRISGSGGCVNIAVVDGSKSGDANNLQYLSPERIEAEILVRELLKTPLSDIDLDRTVVSAKSSIKQIAAEQYKLPDLLPPSAVINFTPDKLDILGNGDTTVLAFKPNGEEDFEIEMLHYDNYPSISYLASPSRTELVKSNLNFSEGTFFLLCTDGGLEILADKFSRDVDTQEYDPTNNYSYLRIIKNENALPEERKTAYQLLFQPLIRFLKMHFVFGNSLNKALSLFIKNIEDDLKKDSLRQLDDATIIFLQKERLPAFINFEKISKDLQPLIEALRSTELPEDTNKFISQYGKERCIKLVEELTDIDVPPYQLFANACALVKYDELSPKTQEWFNKKGLLVLEGENIVVNLKHKEDANFMMQPCHEIGQYLLFGIPAGQHQRIDIPPTQVAKGSFTPLYISDQFPRGACATINSWRDWHATVSGTYIAGTGPNARGILIPAGERPVVYWHTENSYEEGSERRSFYVNQSTQSLGSAIAWYGMRALGKYLTGEIPAV